MIPSCFSAAPILTLIIIYAEMPLLTGRVESSISGVLDRCRVHLGGLKYDLKENRQRAAPNFAPPRFWCIFEGARKCNPYLL